jgi:hypothetical protein
VVDRKVTDPVSKNAIAILESSGQLKGNHRTKAIVKAVPTVRAMKMA